jgi:hypothetical protein
MLSLIFHTFIDRLHLDGVFDVGVQISASLKEIVADAERLEQAEDLLPVLDALHRVDNGDGPSFSFVSVKQCVIGLPFEDQSDFVC